MEMRRSLRNLKIACNHRGLTHYGGVCLFHEFIQVLRFREFTSWHLSYPRRNHDYSVRLAPAFASLARRQGQLEHIPLFISQIRWIQSSILHPAKLESPLGHPLSMCSKRSKNDFSDTLLAVHRRCADFHKGS